jgi:hypothetical protein
MDVGLDGGRLERWLAPRSLLAGVVCSFLACCVLGRALRDHCSDPTFERFNLYNSYLTLYYPTVGQTLALARERGPERALVIVGGHSVMQGCCQGEKFWTRQLQELLGPDYRVVNLAIAGTCPCEVGAVVAEALAREHPRLIFVTHTWTGAAGTAGAIDGNTHRYFYWSARAQGLLEDHALREEKLASLENDPALREARLRGRLGAVVSCDDLWAAFTYHCANTVWCPRLSRSFLRPRGGYPDPDCPPPLSTRYPAEFDARFVADLSAGIADRHWSGADDESPMCQSFKERLPDDLRRRTLVLLTHQSPHYVSRMSEEVRGAYRRSFATTARVLELAGCQAVEVGRDFTEEDFFDYCHVSDDGAGKMAAEVAPAVRRAARELGYIP